jgi:N-acetylmuramoyl-L-alanine amidase
LTIPVVHPSRTDAFAARDLTYGSQGYDVDELQNRLRLLGYYWGKIDGIFGWTTYWAVRTFQYNFGMKVTGYVDMATKMKLVKATPNWHYQPSGNSGQSSGSGSSSSSGQASSNASSNASSANQSSANPPVAASAVSATLPESLDGLSQSDLNLMAHVVYGEARGESLEGQVAIAAVILNRLHSSKFPNTVPSIIYSPGAFTAVSDGQANLTPNDEAKRAVVMAVDGWDPTHGALFYFNPAKTNDAWMWSRPEITTIGHHIFTM